VSVEGKAGPIALRYSKMAGMARLVHVPWQTITQSHGRELWEEFALVTRSIQSVIVALGTTSRGCVVRSVTSYAYI